MCLKIHHFFGVNPKFLWVKKFLRPVPENPKTAPILALIHRMNHNTYKFSVEKWMKDKTTHQEQVELGLVLNLIKKNQLPKFVDQFDEGLFYENTGVLAFQKGKHEDAVVCLSRASLCFQEAKDLKRSFETLYCAFDLKSRAEKREFSEIELQILQDKRIALGERPKLDQFLVAQNFSEQEWTFLELLHQGPKDRTELMSILFDSTLEYETAENRLKNLVGRIRKKLGNKLLLVKGKYELFI